MARELAAPEAVSRGWGSRGAINQSAWLELCQRDTGSARDEQ